MSIRAVAGVAVAAGLALMGCSDDDSGGETLGSGGDYTVVGALAELPASLATGEDGAHVEITTGDLVAASEAAGIERPTDLEDPDAMAEWLDEITGRPVDEDARPVGYVPRVEVFMAEEIDRIGEFDDQLGWSLADADSFVEYVMSPVRYSVVSGPYDDGTLDDDLIDLGSGVVTTKDSEDLVQDLQNLSVVDPLGRAVRLAQDGDRIVSSLQTPPAEEWVEGLDESLADDEDLTAVAEALDGAGVFSAHLAGREAGFSSAMLLESLGDGPDADVDALGERLDELELPPSPFHTVGIGWGADDEGAVITIAYQHDSDEAASENAGALEQLLTEGETFVQNRPVSELYDLVDVGTDGTVATVTIRPGPQGHITSIEFALLSADVPFVHR